MKNTICTFLFVFFLCVFHDFALAQSRFFFTGGTGFVYYNGDLNDKSLVPSTQLFKLQYSLGLGYNIDKRFDITLNYFYGNLAGDDKLTNERDNKVRNLDFRSPVDEWALMLRYKLFRIDKMHLFNPYIFAGFGVFSFKPQGSYHGAWYDLQPLGTEGQYIPSESGKYPLPYELTEKVIPAGVGVYYWLSPKWKLKLELVEHFTFTDYLDDVSNAYPDSTALSHTPNGPLAVLLSSKRPDNIFPYYGKSRGNTSRNDNYVSVTFGIVFNPARSKQNEFGKVGFFKRLFGGKKGWWGGQGSGL